MLSNLVALLSIPLLLLNFGGAILGGVWLAILGEWKLIGIAVVLVFTAHWILTILMIPGMLISAIALKLSERQGFGFLVAGFLSQAYTNFLMFVTCAAAWFVCSYFYFQHEFEVGFGYLPYLLLSWGMALGPWQFFASKEQDNEFTAITLFSASAFYFLFLCSLFLSQDVAFWFMCLFFLGQVIFLPIFMMYLTRKIGLAP